jgi:glycyl-tRNA synthetase
MFQVDCKVSKLRYRADQVFWAQLLPVTPMSPPTPPIFVTVLETNDMLSEATTKAIKLAKKLGVSGPFQPLQLADLTAAPADLYHLLPSPATGEPGHLTVPRDFNLMFKTEVGAVAGDTTTAFMRPETAQGIFTNFLAVKRAARMKVLSTPQQTHWTHSYDFRFPLE